MWHVGNLVSYFKETIVRDWAVTRHYNMRCVIILTTQPQPLKRYNVLRTIWEGGKVLSRYYNSSRSRSWYNYRYYFKSFEFRIEFLSLWTCGSFIGLRARVKTQRFEISNFTGNYCRHQQNARRTRTDILRFFVLFSSLFAPSVRENDVSSDIRSDVLPNQAFRF